MVTGEAIVKEGAIMPEPSDDEQIPAEQDLPLILPRPLDAIHRSADPRYAVLMDVGPRNDQTPERPGCPLDATSTKEARTYRDIDEPTADINLKHLGFLSGGDKNIRLDVNQGDRERPIKYPLLG